ncbi:MAG: glutaredoxin domain-containing protein [Canibacter sp.]
MSDAQPFPEDSPAVSQNSLNSEITMFGADWCIDCRRAKDTFAEVRVPYRFIDLEADEESAEIARDISGRTNIPVIVYPDHSHQVEPSRSEIISKLQELGLA